MRRWWKEKRREEQELENLTHYFSKHYVDVLADPANVRLQAQGCALSLKGVHLPTSRAGLVQVNIVHVLKVDVEQGNIMLDILEI